MKFLKYLKNYAWEMIIFGGGILLFFIFVIYFRTGFDKTAFWQSVLPSAFVDVISIMITTFLITFLLTLGKDYKNKKDFYEIIKMKHIKIFYQLENDYLSIFTTPENRQINNNSGITLKEIPNYIDSLEDDFFEEMLFKNTDKKEEISRTLAFLEFERKSQGMLLEFIQKYSSIMPTEYKKEVFKLDHLLDYSIFPSFTFVKSILIEDHEKFTSTLYKLSYYFEDIDKGRVSRTEEEKYGWVFLLFVSLTFVLFCCLIVFCIYLYDLK